MTDGDFDRPKWCLPHGKEQVCSSPCCSTNPSRSQAQRSRTGGIAAFLTVIGLIDPGSSTRTLDRLMGMPVVCHTSIRYGNYI